MAFISRNGRITLSNMNPVNIYADNPEITREYKIAVYSAWLDRRAIQFRRHKVMWVSCGSPEWRWDDTEYRVAPSEAPKKMVPWVWETVPMPGFLLRKKGYKWVAMALSVAGASVTITDSVADEKMLGFEYLLNHWEHSTDGGKTWKPCAAEVIA